MGADTHTHTGYTGRRARKVLSGLHLRMLGKLVPIFFLVDLLDYRISLFLGGNPPPPRQTFPILFQKKKKKKATEPLSNAKKKRPETGTVERKRPPILVIACERLVFWPLGTKRRCQQCWKETLPNQQRTRSKYPD